MTQWAKVFLSSFCDLKALLQSCNLSLCLICPPHFRNQLHWTLTLFLMSSGFFVSLWKNENLDNCNDWLLSECYYAIAFHFCVFNFMVDCNKFFVHWQKIGICSIDYLRDIFIPMQVTFEWFHPFSKLFWGIQSQLY